jgi:phosphoserine phosphatase
LQHALIFVAPDKRSYHAALMGFGTIVAAYGAGPPAVLGPWEAAEWLVEPLPEDARELIEAVAVDAGVDYALLPAEGRRKRLLIADMDSTIIGCECLDELADYAGKKPEISAITERAMRGELNFEEALTARVAMLAGLPITALSRCFEERVRLNAGAETLVHTMRAHGARAVLVSGGFTYFTSRVATLAGFDAERANTLLAAEGALTGAVGLPILGKEAKLTALQEECAALGITETEALAIGDGANDLAMIQAAGLGLAYRAKPIVAAQADARISHTSLETALFFQGYARREFVSGL